MAILKKKHLPFGIVLLLYQPEPGFDQFLTTSSIRWWSGEPSLSGTSTICRWATMRFRLFCQTRSSVNLCTTASATSALPKPIFAMDFQNDGEYVGGCIAGGRRYLHINANGDCDPCVFIHYSDSNIREKTLLECLQSPIFMAYHDGQPFNENHAASLPDAGKPGAAAQDGGRNRSALDRPAIAGIGGPSVR